LIYSLFFNGSKSHLTRNEYFDLMTLNFGMLGSTKDNNSYLFTKWIPDHVSSDLVQVSGPFRSVEIGLHLSVLCLVFMCCMCYMVMFPKRCKNGKKWWWILYAGNIINLIIILMKFGIPSLVQ